QAIGRWGNFFNQEAFGTNTTLPWGMISDRVSRYLEVYGQGQNPNLPVHPTFLYESLATTAIFLILLIIRNKSKFAFTTTAGYFVLHGVVRFFIEGLRTDSLYIGDTGLRLSQVTSVVMAIVGIALVIISRARGWKRVTTPVDELQKKSLLPQEDIASKATAEANEDEAEETADATQEEADVPEDTQSTETDVTLDDESANDGDGADSDPVR
ncbi:MAG: prolipoprotein diacylglyceryl transferase, partial [Clostridiales bacterium]|nr:prolipoprotein diacylglyceryl transferase [Clostridiales bacterium]